MNKYTNMFTAVPNQINIRQGLFIIRMETAKIWSVCITI
jgi:hypothetical protein